MLAHLHPGLDLTLADLIALMIAVSDNNATNLIFDGASLDAVNATMQSLGMTNSVLGRRILGRLPNPGDPENWATPRDFALAVQAIVSGEAAGTLSIAVFTENLPDLDAAERAIGLISREALALTGIVPATAGS